MKGNRHRRINELKRALENRDLKTLMEYFWLMQWNDQAYWGRRINITFGGKYTPTVYFKTRCVKRTYFKKSLRIRKILIKFNK